MDVEQRLTEIERRLSALEAAGHRQAPKPPEGEVFSGFRPFESVELGMRDAVGAPGSGASPLMTADADAAGNVRFVNVALAPSPTPRVYVARGTLSGHEVTRPVP